MMDPIAQLAMMAGEVVVLLSPATTADYNPTSSSDYAPNADGSTTYTGVTIGPDMALPEGAAAGVTISVSVLPTGLEPGDSRAQWRGKTWTVIKHRPRYYRGVLNGVTLFLGA